MSEQPPQLGEVPQVSDFHVPTLSTVIDDDDSKMSTSENGVSNTTATTTTSTMSSSSFESTKNTIMNTTQSAVDAVVNHPVTQNVKDTVTNGPVAQNVKEQSAKTSAEASKLAATRRVPDTQTSTGQPLTHYHSFFYSLLTWEQPRVTAISYLSIVTAVFIARYVPILRLSFKLLAYLLGTTALTEGLSQLAFSQSLLATVRPRKYYTIPREALESTLEDVEQLLNFFVIESQRLVFAEDASKTFAAFLATFTGYWLIKFTPVWGLFLIAVTTVYMCPLIYITNKELIDEQLANASKVVNAQTAQIKDIAATHTANATESLKGYAGDYTAKAQELIGNARRSVSPAATQKRATGQTYVEGDFPHAPKQEPIPGVTRLEEQKAESDFGSVPAS